MLSKLRRTAAAQRNKVKGSRSAAALMTVAVAANLAACRSAGDLALKQATSSPVPQASACSLVVSSPAPVTATERAEDVREAVLDGADLSNALEEVFGEPIATFDTEERVEALLVLSTLDTCEDIPRAVKDEVPQVVRVLAGISDLSDLVFDPTAPLPAADASDEPTEVPSDEPTEEPTDELTDNPAGDTDEETTE